jgi:hypothetical protein
MEGVFAPLLHNRVPVVPVAARTELPQLSVADTAGADGIALGAATPLPGLLIQPFTVWVTVYVPPSVGLIDAVIAPVFQDRDPV